MTHKVSLITVIVPNYNHEKFLKQRLESIFNQTYTDFEVILLDDCSSDNSKVILLEYSKHPKVSQYVFNEVNSGNTFQQWAKGISLAKGEFIWIAESDDYCDLNFLEVLIQPLLNDKEVALAYCQSNRVNEFNQITGAWLDHTQGLNRGFVFLDNFTMEGSEFIQDFLIYKNVIPNASAVLFRRDKLIIKEHLNIDSYFRYCGDWIFYFRLLINNKVAFASQAINNFRYHSDSVIANATQKINYIEIINIDFKMREDMMRYLSKFEVGNVKQIKVNNRNRIKELLYEQALLYYRAGNKFKTFILLSRHPDIFFKKYHFRKKVNQVIKRVFKSIKVK